MAAQEWWLAGENREVAEGSKELFSEITTFVKGLE